MPGKEYKSFDQIEKDLEILRIEKDLAYYRLKKDLDETKDSLQLKNLVGDTPKKVFNVAKMLSGPFKSAFLTYVFKKIFK